MAEQFSTKLTNYTYTLPTGNTISVDAPDDFLAGLKAEEEFNRIQNNFGAFEGLTAQDLGTPALSEVGSESYLVNNLDIPLGTSIGNQNPARNTEILQERGYTVENGVVTAVPPSADPAVKQAYIDRVLAHIVGKKPLSSEELQLYDLNADGSVNINDVTLNLKNFKNLGTEESRSGSTSAFDYFIKNTPEYAERLPQDQQEGTTLGDILGSEPREKFDYSDLNRSMTFDEFTRSDKPMATTTEYRERVEYTSPYGTGGETIRVDPAMMSQYENYVRGYYSPYQHSSGEDTFALVEGEMEDINQYKALGYNDEDIKKLLSDKYDYRATPTVEEVDQGSMMDNMVDDDLEASQPIDDTPEPVAEPVAEPQTTIAPAAPATTTPQGTTYTPSQAVYTPLQQQSPTYTPTPYSPSAPTVTQAAQVAPATTDFSPQYVAGPVQQTIQLPSSTGSVGGTQTVMYRNQRGQQIPVTEQDGKPMTYVPPGYTRMAQGGMVGYAQGGDVNLNAQYQLATKFLGYQGPKTVAGLNDFAKANPGAAARMGMYQQAMARGGMVRGLQEGGDNPDTTTGGAETSGDDDSFGYYKDVVPMFGDAVSQTMQPMQSTYSTVTQTADQDIATGTGQVGTYAPTIDAAQVSGVETATTPTYAPSATYGAATTSKQVADQTAATPTITGEVRDEAKISAEQGTSSLSIDAAQGTATMMTNPVTREIQDGELISGVADAQKAAKFTEQIQAAQATPSKQATVQGQLEGLMQQFEGGDTPAWAAGAMRNAMGAMAARGLGASSLAGQAAVQAAMESALPIAQADAQTIASFEAQNLSNRQQRAMLGAQQRAQFMGQEFDQAFQARVQNSSRIADIANMNFTAEQQVALENSRAANTMNLANLSNRQAGVMAEAAAIANMDMANLNNRQQAAVQNAQNFLAMDMANLDREQQTALFRSQQNIQALFTDQAAENAAMQFNASSENQTKQFFASLSSQTSQFNAAQTNAVNQFNVNSVNAIREFNSNLQQQRDTFNATNGLVVAQANAQWRQNIATLNTAAANDSAGAFAAAINGMTTKNIDAVWQRERDLMSYNFTSTESAKDRGLNILMADKTLEELKESLGYQEDVANSQLLFRFLFGSEGEGIFGGLF